MSVLGKGMALAALREIQQNGITPATKLAALNALTGIGDNAAEIRVELGAIKAAKAIVLNASSTPQQKLSAIQDLIAALT